MEIKQLHNGSVLFTQRKYIKILLIKHGIEKCALANTFIILNQFAKSPENYKCNAKK